METAYRTDQRSYLSRLMADALALYITMPAPPSVYTEAAPPRPTAHGTTPQKLMAMPDRFVTVCMAGGDSRRSVCSSGPFVVLTYW